MAHRWLRLSSQLPSTGRASNSIYSTFVRRRSTLPHSKDPPKSGYPESLLVYHAGVGRTVFLGCLKVTTLFILAGSCTVLAPHFYSDDQAPRWLAVAAVACGAIPWLFVGFTTRPFVSFVHIKLPIFARRSKESLFKWAQNIPPSTEVDMTTTRFYAGPRVSRMAVKDLRQTRAWLNVANLTRTPPSRTEAARKSWRKPKPLLKFYVGPEKKKGKQPSIWELVLKRMPKESARTLF